MHLTISIANYLNDRVQRTNCVHGGSHRIRPLSIEYYEENTGSADVKV
jgi:hypothetical protein